MAENGFAPRIRALGPPAQALQVEGVWARIGHTEVGGSVLAPGPSVSFLRRLGSATCTLIAHIPWGRSVGGTDCPDSFRRAAAGDSTLRQGDWAIARARPARDHCQVCRSQTPAAPRELPGAELRRNLI